MDWCFLSIIRLGLSVSDQRRHLCSTSDPLEIVQKSVDKRHWIHRCQKLVFVVSHYWNGLFSIQLFVSVLCLLIGSFFFSFFFFFCIFSFSVSISSSSDRSENIDSTTSDAAASNYNEMFYSSPGNVLFCLNNTHAYNCIHVCIHKCVFMI